MRKELVRDASMFIFQKLVLVAAWRQVGKAPFRSDSWQLVLEF